MPILRAPKEPALIDRLKAMHEEIELFIDAKVAALKADCPGVPAECIRRDLTRGDSCLCRSYAFLNKDCIK